MKDKSFDIKYNLICILVAIAVFLIILALILFLPNERMYDMQLLKTIQNSLTFFPVVYANALSNIGMHTLLCPQLVSVPVLISHKKYVHGILLMIFAQISWYMMDPIKALVARERPCGIAYEGYSFPSGHATTSMFFYGTLIFLIHRYVKDKFWKYSLTTLLSILILLVSISRLKLNVHFTTDVMAGLCAGFILTNVYIIIIKLLKK